MLYRVIIAAETVGSTGVSTLSIAQILGVSERNNRRDNITSCMIFHQGFYMQVIEGARVDIDRLLRRLGEDRRLQGLKVLVDKPVAERAFQEGVTLCGDARPMLSAIGQPCLSLLSAYEAERMLVLRQAA
ncbi:BLUF domain-containing protein [Brevundimonas sp.]|uniref:BLUF domain-containing protein n=1 Tax=Brevundimonas sp. TaxID=1871086 RepID=UPI003D0F1955